MLKQQGIKLKLSLGIVLMALITLGSSQAFDRGHYLEGTLESSEGEISPFFMNISHHVGDESLIGGSYYYLEHGIPLQLVGHVNGYVDGYTTVNERWHLTEYDGGDITGYWEGTWQLPQSFEDSGMAPTFQGTWTSPDKTRTLSFSAVALADIATLESRHSPLLQVYTLYPVFRDTRYGAVNRVIQDTVFLKHKNFTVMGHNDVVEFSSPYFADHTFELKYVSVSLISVFVSNYSYTGGAHGGASYGSLNFHYGYNGWETVELADFFEGSSFLPRLRQVITDALREEGAPNAVEAKGSLPFTLEDLHAFNLLPNAFEFHFGHYEAGPYASGVFSVRIPFSALDGVLNTLMLEEMLPVRRSH